MDHECAGRFPPLSPTAHRNCQDSGDRLSVTSPLFLPTIQSRLKDDTGLRERIVIKEHLFKHEMGIRARTAPRGSEPCALRYVPPSLKETGIHPPGNPMAHRQHGFAPSPV